VPNVAGSEKPARSYYWQQLKQFKSHIRISINYTVKRR